MQQPDYSISTPENVDLHLEIAGIGNRLLAQIVDGLIQLAITISLVIVALIVGAGVSAAPVDQKTKNMLYAVIALVAVLFMFFMQNLYFIIWEGAWKGQTPGKKIAEIRVIEANGQPIGWGASLIRNLLRMVDGILFMGLVVMLVDKNERRLGDMCAGTLVIRERPAQMTDSAIKVGPTAAADETLDIGRISPAEYDLLVDYLKRRGALTDSSRPSVAKQMFDHFAAKLDIPEEAAVGGQNGKVFAPYENILEKIYLSYQLRAEQ